MRESTSEASSPAIREMASPWKIGSKRITAALTTTSPGKRVPSRSLSDAVSAMDDQDVSVGVVHHLGRYRPEDSIGAVIAVVSDHDEIDIHGAGDVDNLAPRIAKE